MRLAPLMICLTAITPALAQFDPPAGPVEPTMKTLNEVEPSIPVGPATTPGHDGSVFRISSAGRYHLTGNIVFDQENQNAIEIATSYVTLDLRGYTIRSANHVTGAPIKASGSRCIKIRNGNVKPGSNSDGIDLENCWMSTVENVHAGYGKRSIDAGAQAQVRNCTVERSLDTGIYVGKGSLIESCTIWDSPYNGSNAIETGKGSLVRDCAIDRWDNIGIVAGANTRITDCTITSVNFASIYVSDAAHISGCTISEGDGWGVYALNDTTIENCKISFCGFDGIRAYNRCRIINNACDNNGTDQSDSYAGIAIYGSANTINDNTCRDNWVWGVYVGSAMNTIFRNHCIGNSDDFRILAPEQNHFAGEVRPGQTPTNPNANYRD